MADCEHDAELRHNRATQNTNIEVIREFAREQGGTFSVCDLCRGQGAGRSSSLRASIAKLLRQGWLEKRERGLYRLRSP